MLYTLLKFLGWGLLLALIGGGVGWALRALKCRNEIAQARTSTVDADEVERMRHRLANLEQVVAERDRLRIQLADVRHADSPGIVGAEVPDPATPDDAQEDEHDSASAAAAGGVVETATSESGDESDEDAAPTIVPESTDGDGPETSAAADASGGSDPDSVAGIAAADESEDADRSQTDVGDDPDTNDTANTTVANDTNDGNETVALDLVAAEAELGKKIELDDLSVVEGIGPKISELCNGIGITTWRELADTDVADLQSMLDAAGSRYTVHKPGTWPQQAELLATGRWAEFTSMTDRLEGGK